MKRRNFLKGGLVAGIAPLFVNGYSMNKMAATLMPASNCDFDSRKLVIIYLAGANDIINTAVPLNQYSDYAMIRDKTHLEMDDLITLDSTVGNNQLIGLHKNLAAFKDLYDSDKLSLIQRVSYTQPNRSHFAAEDIMLKGIDGTVSAGSEEEGWIGRFLKGRYPTYGGLPFGVEQDPLGIVLGNTPVTGFHTQEQHAQEINLTGQDPSGFYNIISLLSGKPLAETDIDETTDYGQLLSHMKTIETSTQVYSQRITEVFNQGTNSVSYPDTDLGDQLKTVAKFISGGSRTKVYMARLGTFDYHANAVVVGNTSLGEHANKLKIVNDAIQAFQNDLSGTGNANDVVTVVFSEFGRKVIENARSGHDHGTLSTMFLIGNNVNTGIYGDNPNLSDLDAQGALMPAQMQNDYRTIFGGLLRDWFGASQANTDVSFPNVSLTFNTVKPSHVIAPSCYFVPVPPVDMELSVKVFLEGFYDTSINQMTNELPLNGILPYNQPYGSTKYSYFGDESVTSFPTGTVDWVLLEILNELNIVIDRKAVFMKNDGWLTDLGGNTNIKFSGLYPDSYKIAVVHRNHIGIISNNSFTAVNGSNATFNFTTNPITVNDIDQQKQIGNVYAVYAGDADQSGFIEVKDYSHWLNANDPSNTIYDNSDFNGNGIVDSADELLWKNNRSKFGSPNLHTNLK